MLILEQKKLGTIFLHKKGVDPFRTVYGDTSVSIKPKDKFLASIIPTVLFQAPGIPISVRLDFIFKIFCFE